MRLDLHIEFRDAYAGEITPSMFNSGNPKSESVIESLFCNALQKITNFDAEVIKEECSIRGTTDGLMSFKDGSENPEFFGIQECKKSIKNRSTVAYNDQIAQALLYYVQFDNINCKTIVVNSPWYYDYILIDENIDYINSIKDELLNILNTCNPSTGCKKCRHLVNGLTVHKNNLCDECPIHSIVKEIYHNCLD